MLTMDKIHDIRFRFFVKGENISQIVDALKLDWKMVQKYVDKTDFNEPAPKPASEQRFCPKLDPTSRPLTNGLKRTNKHHVNNAIPLRGYITVLRRFIGKYVNVYEVDSVINIYYTENNLRKMDLILN